MELLASVLGAGDDTYNLVLKSGDGKENALRIYCTESHQVLDCQL